MSLKYINNNGEEVVIAGRGTNGKDGSDGVPTDGVIEFRGEEIPEGYEEVEDPVAALRQEIYEAMWPIGRGFIDFTDTDYSNYLGFTWKRELVGMTPIGKNANDTDFATVGQKGGSKTHTLTQAELPNYTLYNSAHSHAIYAGWGAEEDGNSGDVYRFQRWALNGRDWRYGALGTSSDTIKVDSGGSGQPHNNLPPYQVVSYWKRVDPNAKTMISFTLNSTSYQAEEGMTWEEWCNSNYNTDGYYVSGNYVYSSSGRSVSRVTPTSVITDGEIYYWSKEK